MGGEERLAPQRGQELGTWVQFKLKCTKGTWRLGKEMT